MKHNIATSLLLTHKLAANFLMLQRVVSSGNRWRTSYKERGVFGLRDTRKDNSGRKSEKELTLEEKYARLEAERNLLKAENELLKKIKLMEGRMGKK